MGGHPPTTSRGPQKQGGVLCTAHSALHALASFLVSAAHGVGACWLSMSMRWDWPLPPAWPWLLGWAGSNSTCQGHGAMAPLTLFPALVPISGSTVPSQQCLLSVLLVGEGGQGVALGWGGVGIQRGWLCSETFCLHRGTGSACVSSKLSWLLGC